MGLMPNPATLFLGNVILPDCVLEKGAVLVREGRIAGVGPLQQIKEQAIGNAVQMKIDAGFIAPGYIDLHVHGGAGADFMDGTAEAFRAVLAAHARHGTTSILPTTTVARQDQLLAMLDQCRRFRQRPEPGGGRVLGAHLYGPYFSYEARGCHPGGTIRPPAPEDYEPYLQLADSIGTATVAPELPGAAEFARACQARGIRLNMGHSHATFDQAAEAVRWGVRHVDHLFCAMSDRARLRAQQPYPMRGGLLEATLYFDELTTEVIADGKHLAAELLLLALKIKGPDRLALVTDCNRALDMPEGEYLFGPLDGGEPFFNRDGVGLMPDGKALASGVRGMDHMVRTFLKLTERPIWEVVRMASLTPARIAGREKEIGSLETGKRADILVLDPELNVKRVFIDGQEIHPRLPTLSETTQ